MPKGLVLIFCLFECLQLYANPKECRLFLPRPTNAEYIRTLDSQLRVLFPEEELQKHAWYDVLKRLLLPAQSIDSDLAVVSIVGGGNAGKSTLFNALPSLLHQNPSIGLNQPVSNVSAFAGRTRQMVIGTAAGELSASHQADIFKRFGELTQWRSEVDATQPGPGLITTHWGLPNKIAFIDTPDLDSGTPYISEALNYKHALRVIGASDMLIAIFNISTYPNRQSLLLIREIMEHYGRKNMILILQADKAIEVHEGPNVFRKILLQLAHNIFGHSPSSPEQFPEEVLGAYVMPYSSEVIARRNHPTLEPAGAFLDFATLIHTLNENSLSLRQAAFAHAQRIVVQGAKDLLRQKLKSQLASEVYRAGTLAAAEIAASKHLQSFPFDAAASEVRRRFQNHLPAFEQFVTDVAERLSYPWRLFVDFFQRLGTKPFEKDNLPQPLRDSHQVHDELSVALLLLQLQENRVHVGEQLSWSPLVRDFAQKAYQFFVSFPEEGKVALDNNRIKLPDVELLDKDTQHARAEILRTNVQALTTELALELNLAQWQDTQTVNANNAINQVIIDAATSPVRQRWISMPLADWVKIGIPSVVSAGLAYFGVINHWVLWGMNLIVSTHFLSRAQQSTADQFLRNRLNEWFYQLQKEITFAFFSRRLDFTGNTAPTREYLQAIKGLQDTLSALDPAYSRLPVTLKTP